MEQQVNLYQPALFDKKVPLSARTMLVVLLTGMLCIASVYCFNFWQSKTLSARLEDARKQQADALARLTDFQQQHPPLQKDPSLEAQVAYLQQERERRLPLLGLLERDGIQKFTGYAANLKGLARQDLEGLWLRRIHLGEQGQSVVLEGSALTPALVPRYVRSLSRERVFRGLVFQNLVMSRSDEQGDYIDFVLETGNEGQE